MLRVKNGRSSHERCSVRKGVLRNFAKFTGKHMCQSLFFPTDIVRSYISIYAVALINSAVP